MGSKGPKRVTFVSIQNFYFLSDFDGIFTIVFLKARPFSMSTDFVYLLPFSRYLGLKGPTLANIQFFN
jgi:hypothetical protein